MGSGKKEMIKKQKNPFSIVKYNNPETFCDRESELAALKNHMDNQRNVTLISSRRMGKTGLIHHFFHHLETKNEYNCFYIDAFNTQNTFDFIQIFSEIVYKKLNSRRKKSQIILDFVKMIRPVISYDGLSGSPEISLRIENSEERNQTLNYLFDILDSLDEPVVIAIDEFQQCANYPENNFEATMRTISQRVKNIQFIFSGSNKHMLAEIFHMPNRPFYGSTQTLFLKEIPLEKYKTFILHHFEVGKIKITEDAVDFILSYTRVHTYYTQVVCNRLFGAGLKKIERKDVENIISLLLLEQESIFFQYRNLVPLFQWNLLIAIAKEGELYRPTEKQFMIKNKFGNASAVRKSLQSLVEKELVFHNTDGEQHFYRIYDTFFYRWLVWKN